MPDKVFIDSNICLYILDKSNPKFSVAKRLLQNQPKISTQIVAENVNVCLKKFKLSKASTLLHAKSLMEACAVHAITHQVLNKSLVIMERYGYSIFDSLVIASALDADCVILYTEDMQHQQQIEHKLTIINPFR
jgi:predicted nucleic acid-binding protein